MDYDLTMTKTSLPLWLITFYVLLSLLVPTVIAVHLLSVSQQTVIRGDAPNYLSHHYPKATSGEVNKQLRYKLSDIQQGNKIVPRRFLSTLPKSLPEEPNVKVKKSLFVKTMLPLILRANELIRKDRKKAMALADTLHSGQALSSDARLWLLKLMKRYRVAVKDGTIMPKHISQLLYKMDEIPASLALAQAVIETGWGVSYFAQNHQALYGQWTWNPKDKGAVPANRPEGMTHRIKAFDYLLESVISYMVNLNRHQAYADLRKRRAELKSMQLPVTGPSLAPALEKYSQKGQRYVTDLLDIIEFNKFQSYDYAKLEQRLEQTTAAENAKETSTAP